MNEETFLAVLPGLFIWIAILLLPWRPCCTRETLESQPGYIKRDMSDITVLIPARNEAGTITGTLKALMRQGEGLPVIVVDDHSSDATAILCLSLNIPGLRVISNEYLPEGWSGKLWALERGRQYVRTRYTLLLDADIVLADGLIGTALAKMQREELQMLSLMAFLKMQTFWEKLLMPAFVFFFKLLYPFHLANKPGHPVAAAAGVFILMETSVLTKLGGFHRIKDKLIDDCNLAKQVKQSGCHTWVGMTHSARSIRHYGTLGTIWEMVSRTAFTQLHRSIVLLCACTLLMIAAFILPLFGISQGGMAMFAGMLALMIQYACYQCTVHYYNVPMAYTLALPLVGVLYLLMTWSSACRHFFRQGASWKDRHYSL